jgi:hypothetical protein
MTRRQISQIALGLAGAFALVAATPALACDCDKKAGTTEKSDKKADKAAPAPAPAQQAPPAQEKKADASKATGTLLVAEACHCGAKDPKDCKCGEKCKCTEKTDKPKASAASSTLLLVAEACPCGAKEAKDCKCGEKCKCHEKKPDAPKSKAA